MDLLIFIPDTNGVEIAFPTREVIPELLKEAKERGFYNGNTVFNKIFSHLFFDGGELHYKKNLDCNFINRVSAYLCSFIGSYSPKHEEKNAICALLLSELVNPKKYKSKIK